MKTLKKLLFIFLLIPGVFLFSGFSGYRYEQVNSSSFFKIKFYANGGSMRGYNQVYLCSNGFRIYHAYGLGPQGARFDLSNPCPEEGYIFIGWFTNASLTGEPVTYLKHSTDIEVHRFFAGWTVVNDNGSTPLPRALIISIAVFGAIAAIFVALFLIKKIRGRR